jgi:peptidoglycan hydrolase CwlO-like protein
VKDRAIVVLTAVVVTALGGAAYLFAPALQSDERKLEARVGAGAEHARRILDQFNAELDAATAIVDESGVAGELTVERVEAIVSDDHRDATAALQQESQRMQEMLKGAANRIRNLDTQLAELDGGAEIAPFPSTTLGSSPGQALSTLKQGVQWRERAQKENRSRLSSALSEVGGALSATEGEASGSNSVTANRIKGIAHFQEGDAAAREAALARSAADGQLFVMQQAARALAAARTRSRITDTSQVGAAIATRQEELAAARAQRDTVQARVDALAAEAADLEQRISGQEDIAQRARQRMEELEERGLDYALRDSAQRFAADYRAAAGAYRAAIREQHALRHGRLGNARIDDSGDLLAGGFVAATAGQAIEYVRGLDDVRADLAVAKTELAGREMELTQVEDQLRDVQALREQFVATADRAQDAATDHQRNIADAYAAYRAQADKARAAEDAAIRKYKSAASAFTAAQRAGSTRVSNVPTDLDPAAMERSPYALIQTDRWIGAEARSEAADASVWAALVWFERYTQLSQALAVLGEVNAQAPLGEFDRAALEQAAAEARDAGTQLAEDAVRDLETAARDLGSHWTVAASLAGANYVLSLFGNPQLRGLAIQNYLAVVKDREDNPDVRPFKRRLEQLQRTPR